MAEDIVTMKRSADKARQQIDTLHQIGITSGPAHDRLEARIGQLDQLIADAHKNAANTVSETPPIKPDVTVAARTPAAESPLAGMTQVEPRNADATVVEADDKSDQTIAVSGDGDDGTKLSSRQNHNEVWDDVPQEWEIGRVILEQYEVRKLLGEGTFGKVFLVHDRSWDTDLAVKCPKSQAFESEGGKENFVRECHTWMDLGLHNHIVVCHYVRVLGGAPRVFMEYIDGGSLEDLIGRGKGALYTDEPKKTLERILDIAIQFAWGLHYAHEKGLVHQDIKPANVMIASDGNVKIADFGLANALAAGVESGKSPQGQSVLASYGGMTPAYCSPEQAENAARREAGISREDLTKLTKQTDIYSWAVTVFEMFIGDRSWEAGNIVSHVLDSYLEESGSENTLPEMPEGMAALLRKCLEEDPAARPDSMLEVSKELEETYREVTGHEYEKEAPAAPTELADVLNNKALSFLELGKPEFVADAERLWDEALQLDPKHLESTYNNGLRQWRTARITDQELISRMVNIGADEESEWYYKYLLGLIHIERHDGEIAVSTLEKAKKDSGGNSEVLAAFKRSLKLESSYESRFQGHEGPVHFVSMSSDECSLYSGSVDKTLRMWELASGRCVHTFQERTERKNSPCMCSNGKLAVSCGLDDYDFHFSKFEYPDRTLRLWNTTSGETIQVFDGHVGGIKSACISPDGAWVVSGSSDKTLRLWNAATGQVVHSFEGHSSWVNSVAISVDGRWVLSGSEDALLKLWDASNGRCIRTFKGHEQGVQSVFLSADGRWALSGAGSATNNPDYSMRLWSTDSGECVRSFLGHSDAIISVHLICDGRYAISGSRDHTVRVWDTATGRCLRTLEGHTDQVNSVNLSASGRWALSGGFDKMLRLWRVDIDRWRQCADLAPQVFAKASSVEKILEDENLYHCLLDQARTFLSEGEIRESLNYMREARSIVNREREPKGLELWAQLRLHTQSRSFREGWQLPGFAGHANAATSICLSGDGRLALSGSADKTVRLWDIVTRRCVRVFEGHTSLVLSVWLSTDGQLALSSSRDKTVRVWDTTTGRCLHTQTAQTDWACSVCLIGNNRLAISSREDGSIHLWEVATGRLLRSFQGHSIRVDTLCPSADERTVLSGSADKTLRLWNVSTGMCLSVFKGHTDEVTSVCTSADGHYAISGSRDRTIRVWNLQTGGCVRTFDGEASALSLSVDGRWAFSSHWRNTVKVWDMTTGECLRTLEGPAPGLSSVALSSDGRWVLAAGSSDGLVSIWEIDWELEAVDSGSWDEGVRPYLQNFLTLHTPYGSKISEDGELSELMRDEMLRHELTRRGAPTWNEEDFEQLLHTLGCANYGWLRPEGIKRELEKMAKNWTGPPPLKTQS